MHSSIIAIGEIGKLRIIGGYLVYAILQNDLTIGSGECPTTGAEKPRWLANGLDARGSMTYRSCEGTTLTETANGKLEQVLSASNGYTPQHAHLLILHGCVHFNHIKMVNNAGEKYPNVGHSRVSDARLMCVGMACMRVSYDDGLPPP